MWNSSAFITDKGQPRLPNTSYSASITRAGEAGAAGTVAAVQRFFRSHVQQTAAHLSVSVADELASKAVESLPLRHGIDAWRYGLSGLRIRIVAWGWRRGRRRTMAGPGAAVRRRRGRRRCVRAGLRAVVRRRRCVRGGLGVVVRRRCVRTGLRTIMRFRLGAGMRSGMIFIMMRTRRRRRRRESAARTQTQSSSERRAEGETIRLFHGQHLAFIGIEPAGSSIPNRRLHISIYIKNIFCQTSFSVGVFLKTPRNTRRRRSRR